MKRVRLAVLAALALRASLACAGPVTFESGPARTALLELFTSEGCSSCPPAEEWLSHQADAPQLWTRFAPVAFHVDYWNHLGWPDVWADASFTARQRAYARRWGRESVCTPQLVLNGREATRRACDEYQPGDAGGGAGTLTVTSIDTNLWRASFKPGGGIAARYAVHAALSAGELFSDVKGGENSGRRLRHDFAALRLVEAELIASNGVARGSFALDAPRSAPGGTLALTVWVTRFQALEPLQATGGWLQAPSNGTARTRQEKRKQP